MVKGAREQQAHLWEFCPHKGLHLQIPLQWGLDFSMNFGGIQTFSLKHSPLPIFKSSYLVFCCWIVGVLYIIWILTPYQMYNLQIFSPILYFTFSLFWFCPLVHKSFRVWCSHISLFLLLLPLYSNIQCIT